MAEGSYQVLARKWRPRTFDQVVGQAAIVRTLSNALEQGRVAHAYCFSGIRGVGKTTIARLLAKGLNCRSVEAPTAEPCGTCEACVEIEESRNLDVVEMDAASQTGVDDIRQLNEFARYTPSRDRYRVFIIDEAHMLSAAAFNALLKTLEEPPPHVVFMLATTEPHKILATVLSRCQHYPLGRISQAEITARLREIVDAEGVALSDDGLSMVAIAADGSLRDAQSLLDKLIAFGGDEVDDETVVSLLGMVDRELLFTTVDLLAEQDLAGMLSFVNRMVEQGVDLHQFVLDMLGHLRALLVVATVSDPSDILHLPDGDLERLQAQAERFALDDLDRAFALLSASEYRIKQSEVPRYELEIVLSRLARMPRLEPIESLIAALRGDAGGQMVGPGSAAGGPAGGAASGAGGAGERSTGGGKLFSAPSEPSTTAPRGSDVRIIIDRIRADKPLIAKIVERAYRAELRDDTLFLTFQESGGIFRARLRDRSALAAIEDAAEAALGRKIKVVAGFDGDTGAGGVSSVGDGAGGHTPAVLGGVAGAGMQERPIQAPEIPHTESEARRAAGAPFATAGGPESRNARERQRDELWKRAESEPLVQHFVDALRGNLVDVEDM